MEFICPVCNGDGGWKEENKVGKWVWIDCKECKGLGFVMV